MPLLLLLPGLGSEAGDVNDIVNADDSALLCSPPATARATIYYDSDWRD